MNAEQIVQQIIQHCYANILCFKPFQMYLVSQVQNYFGGSEMVDKQLDLGETIQSCLSDELDEPIVAVIARYAKFGIK